jgi:hypothetical protein
MEKQDLKDSWGVVDSLDAVVKSALIQRAVTRISITAASPVAQSTLTPAMTQPCWVALTVGGGTSGISIFRD